MPNERLENASATKARFGVKGIMLYTVVCCVCFGFFSHAKRQGTGAASSVIGDLGMLMMCLIAIGVAGLGKEVFRISFIWLGKICMSLVLGLIVTIPTIAFCNGQNMSSQAAILCAAAAMAIGSLIGLLLGFRRS